MTNHITHREPAAPAHTYNRFNGLWTVFKKEVVDNLRDRRTLTTMMVSIIVAPLFIIGIQWFSESKVKQETDPVTSPPFELPVIGAEHAPNLMNWLRQNNVSIVDAPDDPEQSIRSGERRVVMVIKDNFSTRFEKGKPAPVLLIHDSSIRGLEQLGMQQVQQALTTFSSQIAGMRLQVRGISQELMQPIVVNTSDVATPESRNAQMLGMLPYLIIMFIMAGGMYLAIDSTAGEREKGSLESLITLPIDRKDIMLAKLLATAFFSALTFLLILIGITIAMKYAPVDSIELVVEPARLAYVFVTCLPFVFVASALLILVASFTKSYKEAQSYMGFITILPSMPLIFLVFLSPEASISNMWIPSLSQALIIIETFKGEPIANALVALSMICSLILAAALSFIAMKLYQREGILG